MMLFVSILAAICYIGYIAFALIYFSNTPSLSQTYYEIEEAFGEGKGRYFTAWCSLLSILIAAPLLHVTHEEWWGFLSLLAVLGVYVVGVTPDVDNSKYTTWHYAGAITSVVASYIIAICEGYWCLAILSFGCAFLIDLFTSREDRLLWIEIMSFLTLISVIIIEILV